MTKGLAKKYDSDRLYVCLLWIVWLVVEDLRERYGSLPTTPVAGV